MHVFIVHCHPEANSFNTTLTAIAKEQFETQGHNVSITDLYAQGFNPVEGPQHYPQRQDSVYFSALTEQRSASEHGHLPADVAQEISRLEKADLIIFQFPLWWHAQPAILKGWFDRVFVYGGLYTGRCRYDNGHFRGKRAICSVTTGAPAKAFSPGGRGGDIAMLMWPIHYSLYYMGFDVLRPFLSHGVQGGGLSYQAATSYKAYLEQLKSDWSRRLSNLGQEEALSFNGWADWNEDGSVKVLDSSIQCFR